MKRLAEGLAQLDGFPPHAINVYLMGDVLVDSGTRYAAGRILRQLKGQAVAALALTHAHPDHQGSSRRVCESLGIPLWCGEADADAAEDPKLMVARVPYRRVNAPFFPLLAGPGHPVSRRLREGHEVAGFTVLETPGHTVGHVSYWRASDRTLIAGDVLARTPGLAGGFRLKEPPVMFTVDPALNRRSARRLAALEPALVCFGHGPPLRDTRRFVEFVEGLPVP